MGSCSTKVHAVDENKDSPNSKKTPKSKKKSDNSKKELESKRKKSTNESTSSSIQPFQEFQPPKEGKKDTDQKETENQSVENSQVVEIPSTESKPERVNENEGQGVVENTEITPTNNTKEIDSKVDKEEVDEFSMADIDNAVEEVVKNVEETPPNDNVDAYSGKDEGDVTSSELNELKALENDEFFDELGKISPLSPSKRAGLGTKRKVQDKCEFLLLGTNEMDTGGANSILFTRRCDKIFCTGCNMWARFYDGWKWADDVEYIFFRHKFPEMVSEKLLAAPGCTAYCCQCSWATVDSKVGIGEVHKCAKVWGCGGGHSES